MLKTGMYVRCSIDMEDPTEPRDFISGKIVEINDFSETAQIRFYDLLDLKRYYQIPDKVEFPISKIQHCRITTGAIVEYKGERYRVIQNIVDKNDPFINYYLASNLGDVIKVCESDLKTTFNSGEIPPLSQLKKYEFQNPMWYFGRSVVNRTIHTIDNAFYGFKELAGCKIFLKPYQLKTVMRCLSETSCRYMIADEVGLGKTIEAASVLKVYLSDRKDKKVLIAVPDALKEQWKTELAFKFRMFDGENINGNIISVVPMSRIETIDEIYDFMIVDEVHSVLKNEPKYNAILKLSRAADNVIMLSATPVQSRNEEYHKLLSLIQPDRYYGMSEDQFLALLELQNKIVRKVYTAVEYLDDYKKAIEESNNKHNDDTKEAFDELVDTLEEIADRTNDSTIEKDIENLSYESDNFSILRLERIVAYICEAYQLEKCVIRNRKKSEDTNNRSLRELPYEMDTEFNNTEFRIYSLLSEWISNSNFEKAVFDNRIIPLINSLFSSSFAFSKKLSAFIDAPEEIRELSAKWVEEDKRTLKNIRTVLDDPMDSMSRAVTICDYLEQEAYDKKVLVFTHFSETHKLYRQLFTKVFGEDHCAFFCEGMSSDELELNAYRFQNEPGYHIMLSDESGGEGRNFQRADELICIDLPWSANTLEQRIGRLDRIGRDRTKDVVSVIAYARDTVEGDLADIWNKGLNIFNKSQSGLEIIMNDIDEKILASLMNDFKYGLSSIVDEMISEIKKVEKQVKEERHFDIAAYTYQGINKQIERTVSKYNETETDLFRSSMMSWASLSGFNGERLSEDVIRFNASKFSPKSAYNTFFAPPDVDAMVQDRIYRMQNHIRTLNGEKTLQTSSHSIQGTFDRKHALDNDYLHFFAPGDGVFDSIVNNAVSAYKGKSSAFALESDLDWEGFVFNWYIEPNELHLLQNGVSLRRINQYRGFLSGEVLSVPVPIDDQTDVDNQDILKELNMYMELPVSQLKDIFANFGKRTPKKDFLGIKERSGISNLSWFKETHPLSGWNELVNTCFKKSREKAWNAFSKRSRINALKETLNKELCSASASFSFFGKNVDLVEKMSLNEIVLEAFSKPILVLDSVCYVRMIRK